MYFTQPAETKLITCPLPVDKDNAEKQRRIRGSNFQCISDNS